MKVQDCVQVDDRENLCPSRTFSKSTLTGFAFSKTTFSPPLIFAGAEKEVEKIATHSSLSHLHISNQIHSHSSQINKEVQVLKKERVAL
jgi:hypothetical protein